MLHVRASILAVVTSLAVAVTGVATGPPAGAAESPVLVLGPSNGANPLAGGRTLNSADPRLYVRGAHLSRVVDPQSDHSDSITPVSAKSFQPYNVVIATDAPKLTVRFRGTAGHYRAWVNGVPQAMHTAPTNGAFYYLTYTFSTRALRNVRFEADTSRFISFTVGATDRIDTARPAAVHAIVVGDSYTEGTGATARFTAWPARFCARAGWTNCWQSGSGGTGYLNDGPDALNRSFYGERLTADVLRWHPDVVVFSGGRNDNHAFSPAQIGAAALEDFRRTRAALPHARLIVTSAFPANRTEATSASLNATSSAIRKAAAAVGAEYLDVMGPSSYVIGATGLLTRDGVHPNQAGHDKLADVLYGKLTG
jgi:lysophospholipase L1-like esterase